MTDYTNAIENATIIETHSPVTDSNTYIIVDVDSRTFKVGNGFPSVIGVVGDHNSNVVSLLLPRFIDCHDIAECAEHMVLWRNENTEAHGEFKIKKEYITTEGEENVILGWLISKDVTQDVGDIVFSLQISDYDEDEKLAYRFKTKKGSGLRIESSGFDVEYPPSIPKSYFTLVDQVTGKTVKVFASNGKLVME